MPATATDAPYLSLEETASLLKVSAQTVRLWFKAGKLPKPIRLGHRLLFVAEEIREAVQRWGDRR